MCGQIIEGAWRWDHLEGWSAHTLDVENFQRVLLTTVVALYDDLAGVGRLPDLYLMAARTCGVLVSLDEWVHQVGLDPILAPNHMSP